ncbi:hypothetical protein CsatB_010921 [Cannabis sativa]
MVGPFIEKDGTYSVATNRKEDMGDPEIILVEKALTYLQEFHHYTNKQMVSTSHGSHLL